MTILWIAVFGALGAVARFSTSLWVAERVSRGLPWGTLVVNLAGCFVVGLLFGSGALDSARFPQLRAAAVTGFLGAFTTFSAFSAESWLLIEAGRWASAGAYVLISVLGCLASTAIGYALANVGAH
ncbi:MAG: fluoride efflux transporter CrcB [bacterium]|nr:fluoride efflux transporter CrcB [bacterium]